MNHKSGFNALSMSSAHRKATMRNMVTSLFREERIMTTKAKAREARRFAEKLITRGKVDSVHNRRQAARFLYDEAMVAKLFTDIGPRMKERKGGYTRILKIGFRQLDNAEMVILELVDYEDRHKDEPKVEKKSAKAAKAKDEKPAENKAESEKNASEKPAESEKPKKTVKSSSETKKTEKTAKTPAKKTVKKADGDAPKAKKAPAAKKTAKKEDAEK